ncbi:Peptidase [Paramyrothecium foliicola]|nr:Peptidase [Paramyrothecium foliicola]
MRGTSIQTYNPVGGLLFWLYIVSALSLTGLIIFDLRKLYTASMADKKDRSRPDAMSKRRSKAQIFMALSVVSFAVLSLHMLYFLIDNYETWAKVYRIKLPRNLFGVFSARVGSDIWKWSQSSTLFKDFARDLCEDPRHYWWTSQSLIYSFGWNLFMTVQGVRYQVPHLWAYLLLGQVLPVSFAQNLFCTAVLLRPLVMTKGTLRPPPLIQQLFVLMTFFGALLLAPSVVHTPYDAPTLLATRALLTAPYFMLKPVKPGEKPLSPRSADSSLRYAAYLTIIGFIGCVALQSWRVRSILSAMKSINDSHAVSALAYGYLIGAGSLVFFLKELQTVGFTCINRNGNGCKAIVSTQTELPTAWCSGTGMDGPKVAPLTPEILTITNEENSEVSTVEGIFTLWAPLFQLNFQSSDLETTTTAGETSFDAERSKPTQPRSTTSEPQPTQSQPSSEPMPEDENGGGLSTGLAAGIGAGVAVASMLAIALIVFVFWRRRRARKPKVSESGASIEGEKPASGGYIRQQDDDSGWGHESYEMHYSPPQTHSGQATMVRFDGPLSLLTALVAAGTTLAQLENTGLDKENVTFPFSNTRYVVEFSEHGSAKFRKRDGKADTEGFYEAVKETNITALPALNFTTELFHGASFDILNGTAKSIEEIEALIEVEKVWPVTIVYAPQPDETGKGPEVLKWDPHVLTRVNDAHEHGYDGSDIIVAVVDSGIDYTHPSLGGKFGPGNKVESGWDFVGDAYNVEEPSVYYPDDDPMDCMGHGTHVAGIVASGNKDLPGVAPNARLRAYKVFGCGDGTTEDVIAKALIQAFEDGADIITASLGSNSGFTENLSASVISKITAQGTFVSAAAGNSGIRGPFVTSSLGNGYGSLTVGSVEHTQKPVYKVVAKSASGESRDIYYVSANQVQWNRNGSYKAYMPPIDRDWDLCREWDVPAPPGGIPENDIVVLPRGRFLACENGWQLMDSNLIDEVKWVFFYNYPNISYEHPDRAVYRDDQPIGFAAINYEDGIWLEEQDEAGHSIEFIFDDNPAAAFGVDKGAASINDFSSWGATLNGRMKPEISAPGGSILSTYPVGSGSWAVFSGTSMATPYIAGVAALFFQSVGGRSRLCGNPADAAHRRIVASGSSVQHSNGTTVAASLAQQGAGLVDAFKVVAFDTSISPANINLNDTMFFSGKHTITVKNSGNSTVLYTLGHEPSSTTRTRGYGDAWISVEPDLKTDQGLATVKFSTAELEVPARGSATFDVEFAEPDDVDPGVLAMYGGSIHIVGSNGEAVKTTYFGIKGALYDADTWEIHRGVPVFFGQGGYGDVIEDGREFVRPAMPELYFNALWSTRELSFDIVLPDWEPADFIYPPVPGKNKFLGHSVYYDPWTSTWFPFPLRNLARAIGTFWLSISDGLAHGEKLNPGEYRILARALRTYGKHESVEDWQIRLSPVFKLVETPGNGTRA